MQLLPMPKTHQAKSIRSCSGASTSSRPIAEGMQRFDLAEYLRRPDAVKPNAGCIGTISNGKNLGASPLHGNINMLWWPAALDAVPSLQPPMPRVVSWIR